MLGLEFYTDNGFVQISDKTPALGFLRKAADGESNLQQPYYNFAEVYGAGGKYFFAPIYELGVYGNSGLEVYSEKGELMFSSSMKLLSFVKRFYVDVPNNKNTPFVYTGEAGRRYGYMIIKDQHRSHYKHKQFIDGLSNPPYYDDWWEFDVYAESFEAKYSDGRIEIVYSYEYAYRGGGLEDPGTWSGPPPLMEGFIVDLTAIEG
ncbi:hypothetical protein [Xenorhabdus miraniensis]|uniref:Uncharacterized protein n=1 Tax=Xenorhabdus miraniensis TaxID=351674 RepID=A0A2D0JJ96_9GAMM|nr:hypothetical protein [Xenorhabdus miraniensis]PHM45219.1 hypothetical protein Xmir_04343 [Xenorhabdus miraniensis]